MAKGFHLLQKNDLPGDIEIHTDLLSIMPSALSRKRAQKFKQEPQRVMQDPDGAEKCLICDPSRKPTGHSEMEEIFRDRVAHFKNDYPYLPWDQQLFFLWHASLGVRRKALHRFQLKDFWRVELYWLLRACVERSNRHPPPKHSYDLMRLVAGFNLGSLAGQSVPHFHIQYGWEVALNRRLLSKTELDLYFEELETSGLIISKDKDENDHVKLIAPWTPKGQYAVDLYFTNKYEVREMNETDLKVFAVVGHGILQKYLSLGIQNVNIVISNSPHDRKIEPLVVHFVPRVNMTALYEIKGVNVVDTPPQKIAEEFRRYDQEETHWAKLFAEGAKFDPDREFEEKIAQGGRSEEEIEGPSRENELRAKRKSSKAGRQS